MDGTNVCAATGRQPQASPDAAVVHVRLERIRKSGAPAVDAADRNLSGVRLIGEDLSGLDLSGCDLSDANLSRANLSGSKLIGARLCRATLFEADLSGCELLSADLSGADLSDCRATGAGFGSADLSGARLFQARLEGATFTRARMGQADLRGARMEKSRLLETDLSDADLYQAVLDHAELQNGTVSGANFAETDLRHARIRRLVGYARANWVGADIQGVDFCGAYLIRRTIADQNYLYEFRNESRGNAALYWVWWLTSDCGRSFLRWGLWTCVLAVVFAGLYELVTLDYGDHPTFLSSLYYSVVTLTTLGYGDVLPASPAAQFLAMVEVVLGYVMLGGLLSIFSNKMARRAD